MSTHQFVYETFLIYIFIKSLVFAPLLWIACVFWWAERRAKGPEAPVADSDSLSEVVINS